MEKAYYKEYYKLEREHWWFKARLKILEYSFKKWIDKGTSNAILNVGAATGATSLMLKNYGLVQSLEYDKQCSVFLSEILNEEVTNASVTNLPFKNNTYNVVCGFDIIEHVENDTKALSEIYRVTKDDGYVFLTVPAFNFLWSKHDEINHHYRRYNISNLNKLVTKSGFEIEYVTYFNFFLFLPILFVRILSKLFPKQDDSKSTGSDFEKFNSNGLLNKLLYWVFLSEKMFFKFKFRLPFGVSALIIAKKRA